MNIVTVLGVGIIGALLAVTVRGARPELGMCVALGTGCIIIAYILPYIAGILDEIKLISSSSGVRLEHFASLIKIIGIAYITQFSSEMIKDAGEGAIAKKVELAGKIAVLFLVLPILKGLIGAIVNAVNIL